MRQQGTKLQWPLGTTALIWSELPRNTGHSTPLNSSSSVRIVAEPDHVFWKKKTCSSLVRQLLVSDVEGAKKLLGCTGIIF